MIRVPDFSVRYKVHVGQLMDLLLIEIQKFFATSESSITAAGNNNIKTVHDVPLMPETRAAKRLQHSAEAICSELPQQSSHQCDQSSTPSCDGVFPSMEQRIL